MDLYKSDNSIPGLEENNSHAPLSYDNADVNAEETQSGSANEQISTNNATEIYSKNPEVQATIETLLRLGCPPIPVAPANGFVCGKAPSFIDKAGKTKLLTHKEYQGRLPNVGELREWFADPRVGVGTLGDWAGISWIDIDRKNYESQTDCDADADRLLEKIPPTWVERSGAGGYHIAVKFKTTPTFTKFATSENGSLVGEVLKKGLFCVLAPSIHPKTGKAYECLHFCEPCEVDSLESIGLFRPAKQYEQNQPSPTKPKEPVKVQASDSGNCSIDLIPLLAREHQHIFTHGVSKGQRGSSAQRLAYDLLGVEARVISEGYSVARSARDLWVEGLSRFTPQMDQRDIDSTWRSAENNSDKEPCASSDFDKRLQFQVDQFKKTPTTKPKKAEVQSTVKPKSDATVPHWILSAQSGMGLPLVEKVSKSEGSTYLLPSHMVAVQYTLERFRNKVGTNGHSLYWLNELRGIFERVSISKIDPNCKARLTDKLTTVLENAHPCTAIPLVSQTWIKGFRDLFVSMCEPINFYTGRQFFPCKNGVLDVFSKKLHSYSEMIERGVLFDWQSCADYVPDAKCPSMMQWLAETLSDADTKKLRASAYVTLLGLNNLKILVELVGERDTGKSVFQRVMTALVSPEKHKALEMRKVNESNFTLSNLAGKKLATIPDTKGFIGSPDVLKRLSGLDTIDAEGKGKDAFDMVFPGIIWLAGNDLIRTADDDDAFQSRRIVLRFPNIVPQEKQKPLLEFDHGSGKTTGVFASELSGILNWIIDLGEQEAISIIKSTKSDKTQYTQTLLESNTIAQWLDQNCVIGFDDLCVTEVGVKGADSNKYLYANYLQYCEENGLKHPVAIKKFKSQVLDISNKTQDLVRLKSANPKSHGTRSVIVGLQLIHRSEKGDPDVDQLAKTYHPLTGKPADEDLNRYRQMELAQIWTDELKAVESVEQTSEKLESLYDYHPMNDEGVALMKLKLSSKQKQFCKTAFESNETLRVLRDAVRNEKITA